MKKIISKDCKDGMYWLIGTLISLIVGADVLFICCGISLNKSKVTLYFLIIVSIIAAIATFFISTQWCKSRIAHHNGELKERQVMKHPSLIAPVIMTLISYSSSNVQVAVIVFIISLENAILVTGLAQTVLKLKLAKEISTEEYLPKYML